MATFFFFKSGMKCRFTTIDFDITRVEAERGHQVTLAVDLCVRVRSWRREKTEV